MGVRGAQHVGLLSTPRGPGPLTWVPACPWQVASPLGAWVSWSFNWWLPRVQGTTRPFCFPARQQGGGDEGVCIPCISPRTGPAGRQWVLRKHRVCVLVCAPGLQEMGWERSLPGQPRDPLPTPHLGGGPLAPLNPEKVPRPPPPARPSPGLPGRLLGTSGAGRGSPGPRQQPRANTTIVFPPGASKGRLAAKPGGSGEPPAGAGGAELQLLRPRREVDGAGWHPLSLDPGCLTEPPSALRFIHEMGTSQPGSGGPKQRP